MRVLMLTWEFPPRSVGGIAAHVDGLCQALAQAGNDVVLLTLSHPGAPADSTVDGVRVLRARTDLPWLPDDDLVARVASANHHLVQLVTRLERGWAPDVVHAHDWQVAWAADTLATLFGAASSPRSTRPSVVATAAACRPASRARSTPSSRGWPTTPTEVLANSKFMVSEVIDGFELPAERTHLIPNGIDPTWWATGEFPGRPVAARVHVGPGAVREGVPGAGQGDAACCARACRASSASSAGAAATCPSCSRRSTSRASATSSTCPASSPTTACATWSTGPGAWPSRRSTNRSASSPSRRWPAAPRWWSPARAGWPS